MATTGSVAVLGSHGFVGSALVRELLSRGEDQIIAVDRLAGKRPGMLPDDPRIISVTEDVRFLGLADIGSPRLVYYLCAAAFVPDSFADPAGTQDANVTVLRDFLTRNGPDSSFRLVYVSSGEVYGNVADGCADEGRPILVSAAMSPYGQSRVNAEETLAELSMKYSIDSVAARLFNVIGPRATQPYFVPEMIRQILAEDAVRHGDLDVERDLLWVGDAVKAIAAAEQLCGPATTAVNIATGNSWPLRHVLGMLLDLCGHPGIPVALDPHKLRPLELRRLVGCPDRAAQALGWQSSVTLEDALIRTIRWYRDEGSWPYETGLR